MSLEEMLQGMSNAKSLLRVYMQYCNSAVSSNKEFKDSSTEIKLIKNQLIGQLLQLKKLTKQMEKEVKPGVKLRTV